MGITDGLIEDFGPQFFDEEIDDQAGLQFANRVVMFVPEVDLNLFNEGLEPLLFQFNSIG